MKIIKFDLPINGIKVKTLEELRDNLTDELVSLARSGQLVRWLKSRQLSEVAQAVEAGLAENSSDAALFMAVCAALEVDVNSVDVEFLFAPAPPAGKKLSTPKAQLAPHLQKAFDLIEKFPEEEFSELENIIEKLSKDYDYKKSDTAFRARLEFEGKVIIIKFDAARKMLPWLGLRRRIKFLVGDGEKIHKGQKIANLFPATDVDSIRALQAFHKNRSGVLFEIQDEIFSPVDCFIKEFKFKNDENIQLGDTIAIALEIK